MGRRSTRQAPEASSRWCLSPTRDKHWSPGPRSFSSTSACTAKRRSAATKRQPGLVLPKRQAVRSSDTDARLSGGEAADGPHGSGAHPCRLELSPRSDTPITCVKGSAEVKGGAEVKDGAVTTPVRRAAPRTTYHAPRTATHHDYAPTTLGPGPPGSAARKKSPRAHPFFRHLLQGRRAKVEVALRLIPDSPPQTRASTG